MAATHFHTTAIMVPGTAEHFDLYDVQPHVAELQKTVLAVVEKWSTAFESFKLYHTARRNQLLDSASLLEALTLEIQYQLCEVSIHSMFFTHYQAIKEMTPQFRKITDLCAALLPLHPSTSSGPQVFTIDNGTTMALFIVAVHCREPEVRVEAANLLKMHPRQEGFWSSHKAFVVAQRFMLLEESNEEGSLVEQWARLRKREVVFRDSPQGGVHTMKYIGKDVGSGTWMPMEEIVEW
jgi:hypothetical protein